VARAIDNKSTIATLAAGTGGRAMTTELDRHFARLAEDPRARNALMAIRSRDGRLDWRGVPDHLSRDTRFCVASCSKLYTGALILQLVQEGKIASIPLPPPICLAT
jgi:CubicO group peptidase (beta-lactamase class C family)